MNNRISAEEIHGWIAGSVGARRISVLSFVRIQKSLGISLVVLTLCSRILIAQSNQPDNTTPASEIRSYDSPNALQSYGVTSEEFERLVGLQPQTALPTETSVNSSPPPVRSVQPVESANPMELRSPFPGHTENVLTAGPQPNNPAVDFVQTIPYWQQLGAKAILTTEGNKICQVDLEQLIWQSMQYSPRVQSILIAPKIQRTDIALTLVGTAGFETR